MSDRCASCGLLALVVASVVVLPCAPGAAGLAPARSGLARPDYSAEIRDWSRLFPHGVSLKFDAAPAALQARRQELTLRVDPSEPKVEVSGTITLDVVSETDHVWFFRPDPKLESVLDQAGRPLSFSFDSSAAFVRIDFPEALIKGTSIVLHYTVSGTPSCASNPVTASCGFAPGFFWMLGLDFALQPVEGPRHIELEIRLQTPDGFTIAAALEPLERTRLDDGLWQSRYRAYSPASSFGFSASSFARVERISANGTTIRVYSSDERRDAGALLASWADEILTQLESWLGPYPYPTLVIGEFSKPFSGAFAPQAAAFLAQLVLDRRASDPLFVREVLAHELSHQWFGHVVAVYDSREILLQEGIAEWLAGRLLRELDGSERLFRRNRLEYLYGSFDSDESALAPFQSLGGLRRIAYAKASVILDALRYEVGDATFLDALRRLTETRRFEYVTVAQLQSALEEEAERSLARFFEQWIARPGVPELRLQLEQPAPAAARRSDGSTESPRLRVTQLGSFYDFDLRLTVIDRQSRQTNRLLSVIAQDDRFPFDATPSELRWDDGPYPIRVESLAGDLNLDGYVDGRDLLRLASRIGARVSTVEPSSQIRFYDESWNLADDPVHDGVVDRLDLEIVQTSFGTRL
ncbi:MAG: hypothetical protein KC609_14255 [Myxococcales bacterium]|nr:hypothetical protein [Myxococcales bacterium]